MALEVAGGTKLLDPFFVLNQVSLREKMRVADLGCGAVGHFVFPAAKLVGRDGLVYAVDIQKRVLENIEKKAKVENAANVVTIWSDLERFGATKIDSGSLDVAMLLNTIFQVKDKTTVLKESARMLKVGGHLIVVDWLRTGAPFGPPVEGRVEPSFIEQEADKIGLHLTKRFSAGPYHYGLIFEK